MITANDVGPAAPLKSVYVLKQELAAAEAREKKEQEENRIKPYIEKWNNTYHWYEYTIEREGIKSLGIAYISGMKHGGDYPEDVTYKLRSVELSVQTKHRPISKLTYCTGPQIRVHTDDYARCQICNNPAGLGNNGNSYRPASKADFEHLYKYVQKLSLDSISIFSGNEPKLDVPVLEEGERMLSLEL